MQARIVAIAVLLGICSNAFAQYTIGNYYYSCPVGVSWNDPRCSRQEIKRSSPRQPLYRWQDKWGAIYIDSPTGTIGSTAEAITKEEAEATALQRCRSRGGQNCNKAESFVNSCGVVAWPKDAPGMIVTRVGPDLHKISQSVLDSCQKHTAQCYIALQLCATPRQIPVE